MTTTVLAYLPSPSQGVWHLGPVPIRAYALCIIVGIVAALIIGDRRWQARGGEAGVIYDIALWAVPFGLVGGRLYHVLTDWPTYFGPGGKGLGAAFQVWEGGLGIWGAVALGGVGAWIGCRTRGIPLPAFGDAIAPGIILAQAIGRLGNYFNQELYGGDTTLPWGLEIYQRVNAAGNVDYLNGVSTGEVLRVVHPTFLYELLWNLLVFALLIWADRRFNLGHGRLFALYVAGYCAGRFLVELMRSDPATEFAGIRVNTFTSTFVFIGAIIYIMLATKGREDPATLAGKRDEDEEAEAAVDELGKELVAAAATTGVVAAATVAGQDDDDENAEDADHMHPDEVGASEDDGAEAAAAIELKAISTEPDEDESAEPADEAGEPGTEAEAGDASDEAEEEAAEAVEDETAEEQPAQEDGEPDDQDGVDEPADEAVEAEAEAVGESDEPAAAGEDAVDEGADESAEAEAGG
ncbi:prolipoprotein diacylglyceryl transferase, partial [Mycobacterium sp. E802]|uniref:prolipoprotein diacylglyceryl transferase n=1 Tax=Mycobacterium sp. E802 TaxID=1834152 RepID=UPI0007FE474C